MATHLDEGPRSPSRPPAAWSTFGAAIFAAALALAGPAKADIGGSFGGTSYGAAANALAGPVAASLGRTAQQACPCRGTGGRVLSTSADSVEAGDNGNVLRAAKTEGATQTQRTANSATVRNTGTVSGLNMLDGLITASAVKGIAEVRANRGSMSFSTDESSFTNLKVAGNAVAADVAANTRIVLPGIGRVTLKAVSRFGDPTRTAGIAIDMLKLEVLTRNRFGLRVGSEIVVGHAESRFSRRDVDVVVGGLAYGTSLDTSVDEDLSNEVGRAAQIGMPCEGTRGNVQGRHAGTVQARNVLSLGSAQSTRQGGATSTGTMSRMTSRVAALNLLGGLVQASEVRAIARSVLNGETRTDSAAGSGITGLRVAGVPVGNIVGPNRRIAVPGIGFLIANEQIFPEPGVRPRLHVNGLRLVVNQQNLLGLAVGAELIVAHAESTVFE